MKGTERSLYQELYQIQLRSSLTDLIQLVVEF